MDGRSASQILGACGALGYLPAPAALEELLAGAASTLYAYIFRVSAALCIHSYLHAVLLGIPAMCHPLASLRVACLLWNCHLAQACLGN
jgi:hypothetical protein